MRLGNGRWFVMCSGRVERGVLSGRERLMEDVSGAMGLRIKLTRLSMSMSEGRVKTEFTR